MEASELKVDPFHPTTFAPVPMPFPFINSTFWPTPSHTAHRTPPPSNDVLPKKDH
jgi:hypothetical protein